MQKYFLIFFLCAFPFFTVQAAAPTQSKQSSQEAPAAAPDQKTAEPSAAPSPHDASTNEPVSPEHTTSTYETAFVKMIATLLGLIILIILSVWMLRRISQGRFSSFNSQKGIKILEKRPLSAKSMLYLVEVRGKKVLISESQFEVRRLADIDEISVDES